MISFKTPLNLKYYFLAHWYRMFNFWLWKIYFSFVLLLIIFDVFNGFLTQAVTLLLVLLLIVAFAPLLKFFVARFYHKASYVEYYFAPDAYGFSVVNWKIEVKKEQIKNIIIKSDHCIVKLQKGTLYAVAEPSVISQVKDQLLASLYKDLVIVK